MSPKRKKGKKSENWRIEISFLFFLFCFVLVVLRLFQIQILQHGNYKTLAENQYSYQSDIPAKRGDILSSDGYILAGARSNYLLFGEPKKIKEPEKIANELAELFTSVRFKSSENLENLSEESALEVSLEKEDNGDGHLEMSKEEMFKKYFEDFNSALSSDLFWVPLVRDVTPEEKILIENSNLEGLGFEEYPVRFYPEGNLASHVLGFVGSEESGEKVGYSGVEGELNEDLKGKPGKLMEETDALGRPILMGKYKRVDPVQGRDVVLTINRAIQYMVEKKLKEGVEKYNALTGTVIVMNPSTGDVIALANYPTYNPENFNEEEKIDEKTGRKNIEKKNLAIADTYEPGSVMKPLTISTAIDLGIVTPETTFVDNGPVNYSGYYIDNWNHEHYGVQNIVQLLQKSNNIGAAWVGHQVGKDNLYKYLSDFGIGSKTGIDLQGEDTGMLRDKEKWTDIDLANISFGQGVSATPLQVLNAFNAIANGGYLVKPKIISKIVDGEREIEIPAKSVRKVISKETSDTMVNLLEEAAEGGEAKFFILKDYRISGKTGTAQIPEEGKYSEDRTIATFAGFPTVSKSFSMIVRLEEPKESIYASETAVPLWMDIASELMKFYEITPDNLIKATSKE
ncbi:penicillin-binding protein 2 [Patescibacteria group bacterium]|nr:penicillin-binding protein 2 [Patescibacteria group bacterium]